MMFMFIAFHFRRHAAKQSPLMQMMMDIRFISTKTCLIRKLSSLIIMRFVT